MGRRTDGLAVPNLFDLAVALRDQPLAVAAILLGQRVADRRVERRPHLRLVQHFLLRDLGVVEVAGFGDRGLLRVAQRLRLDAGIRVLLRQPLHRELDGRLQGFLVTHGTCSLPFLTQDVPPTDTVRSVKKFQRTYPPPTVPPSSELSPSDR